MVVWGRPDPALEKGEGLEHTLKFLLVIYFNILNNVTLCRRFIFSHHTCMGIKFFKRHGYFIPYFLECFILKFIPFLESSIHIFQSLLHGAGVRSWFPHPMFICVLKRGHQTKPGKWILVSSISVRAYVWTQDCDKLLSSVLKLHLTRHLKAWVSLLSHTW